MTGYYDGRYQTMSKLPMFGCSHLIQVLNEIRYCKMPYPNATFVVWPSAANTSASAANTSPSSVLVIKQVLSTIGHHHHPQDDDLNFDFLIYSFLLKSPSSDQNKREVQRQINRKGQCKEIWGEIKGGKHTWMIGEDNCSRLNERSRIKIAVAACRQNSTQRRNGVI